MPELPTAPATRRMWRQVRRHPDWKATAFVAHCQSVGHPLDKTLVSKMMNGHRRTDADTLFYLADYFGDPAVVYGPYLAMFASDDEDEDETPAMDPRLAAEQAVQVASQLLTDLRRGDGETLALAATRLGELATVLREHGELLLERAA